MQDKIELLNEKLEKDTFDKPDCPDYETNFSKALTKKCKYNIKIRRINITLQHCITFKLEAVLPRAYQEVSGKMRAKL